MFRKILPAILRTTSSSSIKTKTLCNEPLSNLDILSNVITRHYTNEINHNNNEVIADYSYVKNAINNNKILIIDVREPDEVKELGAIPNSVNIPLGTISQVFNDMNDKEFEAMFKKQKPSQDTEVICYCMIGKRSGKAQTNLINLGYKNVKNYLGSWTEWANKTT